jgi:hypothetical protein
MAEADAAGVPIGIGAYGLGHGSRITLRIVVSRRAATWQCGNTVSLIPSVSSFHTAAC